MNYTAYRQTTDDAAAAIRAAFAAGPQRVTVVSLAGGFYGIQWTLTSGEGHIILARDLDGNGEWIAWCESPDGERWSDDSYVIGHVRPRDYAVSLACGAAAAYGSQLA